MSFDEDDHQEFNQSGSGASSTFPMQASAIKKHGYVVIKGRPCKVVETSTSKTGKHGHAKVHIVAIDIFTAKKLEDICPSTHNLDVPVVKRADYQLVDISEEGFACLLTETGETKDDLRLPEGDLGAQIKKDFADGKELYVAVISSMGEESIVQSRATNN